MTLFWDLSEESFYARLGCILYSCITISFGNMVELPAIMKTKAVVIKHNLASMLRMISFTLSMDLALIPIRIIETLIMGTALYWGLNFAPEFGRYLLFIIVILCINLAVSAYFRLISASVPNQPMAQLFAGPSVMIFFLFAGFVVSRETMPVPFQILYWLSHRMGN